MEAGGQRGYLRQFLLPLVALAGLFDLHNVIEIFLLSPVPGPLVDLCAAQVEVLGEG